MYVQLFFEYKCFLILSSVKWEETPVQICIKVAKKYHWLIKLKGFGIPPEGFITAWKVLIRPITEYTAPLLYSGLSIIFKDYRIHYNINASAMTYEQAVVELALPTFSEWRESLSLTFWVNTFNNESHNCFFEEKNTCHTKHQIQAQNPGTKLDNRGMQVFSHPLHVKKLNKVLGKCE